ncbi:hypothetical protein NG791_08770 [Laspinema sp. D1]|uniref:hypothetical protein n=1 Tax=Laspinema palackyanum TaxID=3231601 RepID=UPI0034881124|nr:hypothetical protein [Laspinema sp. D2b]
MALELFNPNYYRNNNPDLGGLSDEQALEHLVTFGLAEGRVFSPWITTQMLETYGEWNCDIYPKRITIYPSQQLQIAFEHLRDFGINEGRALRLDNEQLINVGDSCSNPVRIKYFDFQYYRENYSDLSQFSNEELFHHFIVWGVHEGRQASPSFNASFYLQNSPDLQELGFTNQQAIEHFIRFGINEKERPVVQKPSGESVNLVVPSTREANWSFADVYSQNFYRERYPDLAHLTNTELFTHFEQIGVNEGRMASPYFDVVAYLSNNPDLQQAGFNNTQAVEHFISAGKFENRQETELIGEEERLKNNLATAPFLAEFPLNFRRTYPSSSSTVGIISPQDSVDYYGIEYLPDAIFNFPKLGDGINVKIIGVNPGFLPESLRREPFTFDESDLRERSSDSELLNRIGQPLDRTILPPEAFTVLAGSNATNPNNQTLSVSLEQLTGLGIAPSDLVLVVEASDALENPTPYTLQYRYETLGGPPLPPSSLCVPPAPLAQQPRCPDVFFWSPPPSSSGTPPLPTVNGSDLLLTGGNWPMIQGVNSSPGELN